MPGVGRELHPREVLADLLGSGDFPAEVLDPEGAAEIIMQRLIDVGSALGANPRHWVLTGGQGVVLAAGDRKSTRLNSSH